MGIDDNKGRNAAVVGAVVGFTASKLLVHHKEIEIHLLHAFIIGAILYFAFDTKEKGIIKNEINQIKHKQ